MAEYVRRRYRAARFTATVAVLGVLAGLGLGKAPGPEEVLEFDDAAARRNVITITGNSITSRHIKNGTLLTKDFKKGQLESKIAAYSKKFVDEADFGRHFDAHTIKLQPILISSLEKAFVGEGEFEQRLALNFAKIKPSLTSELDASFVGEGELDSRVADIFLKLDGLSKKYLDSTYVRSDAFDSRVQVVTEKMGGDWLSKKFVANSNDCDDGVPAAESSIAQFDLSDVTPDAQDGTTAPTTVCTSHGFLGVAVSAPHGASAWTIHLTNLSASAVFYSHSGSGAGEPGGKLLDPGASATITQTSPIATRTIQVAPTTATNVPVATITMSGMRQSSDTGVRVTTQTLIGML